MCDFPGCLGHIRDFTTQLYGDCKKTIVRNPYNIKHQYNGKHNFEPQLLSGYIPDKGLYNPIIWSLHGIVIFMVLLKQKTTMIFVSP